MNRIETFAAALANFFVYSCGMTVIMSTTVYAEVSVRNPDGFPASDRTSVRQAYRVGSHAVQEQADGSHIMRNPGQRWRTEFDGHGFLVRPEHGNWTWGMELQSVGRTLVASTSQVTADGNELSYHWNDNVEEWFVNDQHGLQQGWTIQRRPAAAWSEAEGLTLTLNLSGDLVPRNFSNQRSVALLTRHGATALTYGGLKAWDAENRALDARFNPSENDTTLVIVVDDAEATYPITIDPLVQRQQAYLKASNTGESDIFGGVAMSGDTIVVGAVLEDSSATGVNGDGGDNGAEDSGAAYVFVRNGPVWTQQAYLKASNTGGDQLGDRFGAVGISGDTIVAGARWEDSNAKGVNRNQDNNRTEDSGAAYVFVRSGSEWSQQAYLKASNTGAETDGDNFGKPAVIWGDTIVIGAPFEDSVSKNINGDQGDAETPFFENYNSGAVYVFVREGTRWSQQAYIKASNTGPGDRFGVSLAIWGDTLVVGATQEDSRSKGFNANQTNDDATDSGAAYVFVRQNSIWRQQAYLKASNTEEQDLFGMAVAISGDTVVVGSPCEDSQVIGAGPNQGDNSASQAGAVYVYLRKGETWSQQAFLKASNASAGANFGSAVAISGSTLLVGSRFGLRDPEDPSIRFGAAYLFSREGTKWTEEDIVGASNRDEGDGFGAVAISGDGFVVGAFREDSGASGVNGNELDNSTDDAGAAYVFELAPATPLALTDAFLANAFLGGLEFTVRFSGEAGARDWKLMGSANLRSFSDDRTAESTITEISPGNYEAVIDVSGLPRDYYVRIER